LGINIVCADHPASLQIREANMDGERLSGSGSASHVKGSRVINVHAKIVGGRVMATVNVEIGTGRFTYTVQFADQGNDAANEAEAQRKLRNTLEEVLIVLGSS
jgi:hypothetical protein